MGTTDIMHCPPSLQRPTMRRLTNAFLRGESPGLPSSSREEETDNYKLWIWGGQCCGAARGGRWQYQSQSRQAMNGETEGNIHTGSSTVLLL